MTTNKKTKVWEEYSMFRKEFFIGVALALFFSAWTTVQQARAEGPVNKGDNKQKVHKVMTNSLYRPMDINNIFNYYSNNGDGSFNKFKSDNEGFEFPIGSVVGTCIFEDGLVWTAFKNDTLYCGGSTYNHGVQAGRILQYGTATSLPVADDAGKSEYRVYRVRPDIKPTSDAATIASETNILQNSEVPYINQFEGYSASDLLNQYWTDWNQWPANEGAPFTDANGVAHLNGGSGYDPTTCTPGFPGADQTQWMVMNDANAPLTRGLYGSNPIGIEVQRTIWAYNRPGALGNTIFISYTFINKSGMRLDSMYVSQWADPDLGFAGDDATGCDTTRSLGYVYNGEARDANFASLGLPPPSAGFDFFQGPKVAATSADTAIFNMQRVGGYVNLPMTAFTFFINGNATFTDPPLNDVRGTPQWYNLMRGRVSTTGAPFDPSVTGGSSFCYPGDPVTGKGPTFVGQGSVSSPADVRMCLNSGPFSMNPGDTQQVVVAALAGLGADYLSSISVLRSNDDIAQSAYNSLFQLAVPPPQPAVKVANLDNEIVLSWGDPVAAAKVENSVSKGYTFEGYNVYQYQRNSPTGGKLIATYDVVDGIRTIQDTTFSVALGTYVVTPTEYGTDSGIKHALTITQDAFTGGPLVNDRDYYYAVTAYSVNLTEGLVPHALESSPAILDVRPQAPGNGVRFAFASGDSLSVTHAGSSDGTVVASVIDPGVLTGHQYRVNFDTTGGTTTWKLTDVTSGKVMLSDQTQTPAGTPPPGYVIDGVQIATFGPPPGMKDWSWTPSTGRFWTWANGNWGAEGFGGAIGNGYDQWFSSSTVTYDQLRNVEIRFANTDTAGNILDPNDPNASFAYRYLRGAQNPPAQPWFAPIPNPGGSFNYQDFTKSMPFSAWNMETNPPTRLAVGYNENNVKNGLADGKYWPPYYNDATYGDNISTGGPREWFYIFDVPYSTTPDPTLQQNILNNTLPVMWFGTVTRRNTNAWTSQNVMEIITNHINTPSDQFTFTATAPTQDKANEVADISKINVFPNPYFGFNRLEADKYTRWVRFTHLPKNATIRIFNLAGILVRTLVKSDNTQFADWDLMNEHQLPIAAGMYIAHIDCPGIGTKILKLAIIPEQQFLDHY